MLALAIVSIGMISILGLLPSGLQAGRDAADNTLSATVVQDTFSGLRAGSFAQAVVCDTCTLTHQNLGTYSSAVPVGPVVNYYDYAGFSVNGLGAAYYKVILYYAPQSPSLTRVTASVVWPAQSKITVITNVFVTQIARNDQ